MPRIVLVSCKIIWSLELFVIRLFTNVKNGLRIKAMREIGRTCKTVDKITKTGKTIDETVE